MAKGVVRGDFGPVQITQVRVQIMDGPFKGQFGTVVSGPDDEGHLEVEFEGHAVGSRTWRFDPRVLKSVEGKKPDQLLDIVQQRLQLLNDIVDKASPVLTWDREKAEHWLPGLWDALDALRKAEADGS